MQRNRRRVTIDTISSILLRGGKKNKTKKNGCRAKKKFHPDGFQVWLKREPIFEIFWKLEAARLKDQKVLAL